MTVLGDYFLTNVLIYGPWFVGLVTLLSGVGFPVPATMVLLAAGAFVQQGVLPWQSAAILALIGAIVGDNISYLIGRIGGDFTPQHIRMSQAWRRAGTLFRRWGGLSIFLSRFLITPVALPINLLAGSTRYAAWRYAAIVIMGEFIWVTLFVSCGFVFAGQWEVVSSFVSDLSGVLVGVALIIVSSAYFLHYYKSHKSIVQ